MAPRHRERIKATHVASPGAPKLRWLPSNCDFEDEVDGRPLLRFLGRRLDSSPMSWPTFLGAAIVQCNEAKLLCYHALHLSEEASHFGT